MNDSYGRVGRQLLNVGLGRYGLESRSVVVHHLGFWSRGPRFEPWRDYQEKIIVNLNRGSFLSAVMMLEIDAFTSEENNDLLNTQVKARTSVKVDCVSIKVSIERRIQRTVIRGGEGDDLLDEGAESAVYEATANVDKEVYLKVLKVFRGRDIQMTDPYDGRVLKVAFKSISYDGGVNLLGMTLIEDID